MKTTNIICAAIAIGLAACDSQTESDRNVILPEGAENNERFIELIKNIEVVPLQTGDDFIYLDQSDVYVGNNYIYCLYNEPNETLHLMCFDKNTGSKTFSRNISGRGPGECLGVECMTGKNDSLILLDLQKDEAMVFNPEGRFLGKLNKGGLNVETLYPTSDGGYLAFDGRGRTIDGDSCVNVLDSQLNIVASAFRVPELSRDVASLKSGCRDYWYVANDTLRFMYPYSHQLISYPGCDTINFVSANPLSDAQKKSFGDDIGQYVDAEFDGYESAFEELIECGNLILFKYCVNDHDYRVAFDKTARRVLTMMDTYGDSDVVTLNDLWGILIINSHFTATDGHKLYALATLSRLKPLTANKQLFDSKLSKLYDDIQKNLAENTDAETDDFNFMLSVELNNHIK
ncbi:MAG: 6-bladed beta-propeller [Salinivirgaceae bacterium]|nr:6-bladed beta-propeller [Salinivirgaceae bacterium]